ncbi:hypothetical protein B0H11DRAFT_2216025 [Mycena galericulata]|nr:hypothetical protein B0H11DRAFT_2216025 [Mycena galericulata]
MATTAAAMRRRAPHNVDKKFKVSVFAEFTSHETTVAFLSASLPSTFEGIPLLSMSKATITPSRSAKRGLTADMLKNLSTRSVRWLRRGAKAAAAGKEEELEVFPEFMGATAGAGAVAIGVECGIMTAVPDFNSIL